MILLVIYSHVVYFFTIPHVNSELNKVFISFRMPLFFFISGFFVYGTYNFGVLKRRVYNRLLCQLYPTIIFFGIFVFFFYEARYTPALLHLEKRGYWFTLAAVEFFFLSLPILYFLSSEKYIPRKWHNATLILFGGVALLLINYLKGRLGFYGAILGLEHVSRYFVYFIGGMLLKRNFDFLLPYITNIYAAIIGIALFYASYNYGAGFLSPFITGFSAILVIHYIVYKLFKYKSVSSSKISRCLQLVGTMTLEIYLLHYFVIYSVRLFTGTDWLAYHINQPWEFVFVLALSVCVALVCLGAVKLFKTLRIYHLIFPQVRKK